LDICCISLKRLFFTSPSQSSHGHFHASQSTHQRGAVMPAMPRQPAISALRNQQSPIGQNQTQVYNRPGRAKPRSHEKTPLCCHSGVFSLSIFS
jgi:hypothetical protein